MSLSSTSIRRPVLTTVFSLIIILFGIIGFNYLGVREYPSVDQPIVTITTNYTGANASIIETQITEPIEESVNGIAGIRSITSVSRDGRSTITVEFDLDVDLETAANDVRDKVAASVSRIPQDADPPIVAKSDANASPIIFINIKSDKRNLLELTEIAERDFKERLQTIPGVSEIRIWGSKRYAMRLWMDSEKLAAYGITPLDIQRVIQQENVELPTGLIEGKTTELTVRTLGRLQTPDDFNNLIIRREQDRIIRFSDVGVAELGAENLRTLLRRDGIPMVGNAIIPQPNSNNIEITDEVYKRVERIKRDLPDDVEVGYGFDTTVFIRASIQEVVQTIFMAFLLVIVVIFFFLRDWRTTIIPIIVIPISLIGSFFIMYISGFSINVLTLLGIVLAIGLVVDDAIVMMENIYSKIEEGKDPIQAGFIGSNEIFFAVIATTLALVAVFMPVIFLQGLVGRLFREFGVVLSGAVIISSFVALTLTPMLSSRILKRREKQNRFYMATEPFFDKLNTLYESSLRAFIKRRILSIPIMIFTALVAVYFFKQLASELAPLEDRNGVQIFSTGPEGASFEFMDAYVDEIIEIVNEEVPERTAVITVTSPGFGATSSVNSSFVRLRLSPANERSRSQMEIAESLRKKIANTTSARTFISQEQTFGSRMASLPVQFVIQAPNLEKLKEVLPEFMNKASQSDVFQFVDVNLKFNKPEIKVDIKREKAAALQVTTNDIAQTLQLAFAGQRFDYFTMDGKQYQVIGQLKRENRNKPLDLRSLYVRNAANQMIQLDNVLEITEQSTPPTLFRFNRYVSATVSASVVQGKTIGDGLQEMENIAAEVLDSSFSTAYDGTSKDFAESSSSLLFSFILALLLVYLVLAAQFESFRDPMVIMFTVPLALAGALISMWYFGKTLNVFSQIGLIMLIGLVTKNGILIVEFANQKKLQGMHIADAITEASISRFRPILMTSFSTILGTLPIALAFGAGAESRTAMGIAIIGGLVLSSALTLYVIPALYTYVSSAKGNKLLVDENE